MKLTITPAVERNKEPILAVLKEYITEGRLLEIGSGTGEHAVYFATHFPALQWVTTELKDKHAQITARLKAAQLTNLHGPEFLKIGESDFPDKKPFQYVFSANTLHIMSWKADKTLFKLLARRLRQGALVFFYGPFNLKGQFSAPSNQEFDQCLKSRDPKAGIRNLEDVCQAMAKGGFHCLKAHEMPANNLLVVFERQPFNTEE